LFNTSWLTSPISHSLLIRTLTLQFVEWADDSDLVSAIVLLASGAKTEQMRNLYMNLLVDPIQQRFQPAFHTTDLTSKEMDGICNGIEMLEGIFISSQSSTLAMIFQFIMKYLRPIASLLMQVNIEGNVVVAGLRLYELISRKADVTDEWGPGEKKRMEVVIQELLTNYKRWSDGPSRSHPPSLLSMGGLCVNG
jgi:hypothetical protein